MALAGKSISSTYKDMLNVNYGTDNEGFTGTSKQLYDGAGTASPLYIGTSDVSVKGGSFIVNTALSSSGNYDWIIYGDTSSGPSRTPYGHFDASEGSMTWNDVELKITGTEGKFSSQNLYLFNSAYNSGASTPVLSFSSSGEVNVSRPFVTKSTVSFEDASGNVVALDPTTGKIGSSTDKGGVTFDDDGLTVRKGTDQIAAFTDDGRFRLDSVSSISAGTYANGDLINIAGDIYVRTGEE